MKAYRDALSRRLIGEQAVQWLCDLRDGNEKVRQSFYGWLKQSPQHVEEFLLASSVWKALDKVGPSDAAGIEQAVAQARAAEGTANVIALNAAESAPVPAGGPNERVRGARRYEPAFKLAAAVGAVLLAGAILFAFLRDPFSYATGRGEQRTVTLTDGSIVYLNAQSHAKVQFSENMRKIRLLEGEAMFVVAHDAARPFFVTAGTATIQAIGTQFNVRRRDDGAKVSVVEGRVKVTTPEHAESGASTLGAGEEVQVTPKGRIVRSAEPEVTATVAWRERRLVFRGETLLEVAAEFNRYSQRPIRVEGEAARNKRLAGTFNADDPGSLVLFLEKYPDLSVQSTADEFIITAR